MAKTKPVPNLRACRAPENANDATVNYGERIIREPECERRSGLSRSTRWRLERDGKFPRRRRISPGTSGWLESEFAAWIRARGLA
jgi:prophage regulatory protein